jgi:hypothetical protein
VRAARPENLRHDTEAPLAVFDFIEGFTMPAAGTPRSTEIGRRGRERDAA